jgi:hypothetical protein
MRRVEGHQQEETKSDEAVFTESAAVKVSYILLRLSTRSRHNRAPLGRHKRQLESILLGSSRRLADSDSAEQYSGPIYSRIKPLPAP